MTPVDPSVHGLVEIADGCAAWLQPNGSWGLSNAGIVAVGGHVLLVDTLYDARRTQALLDAVAPRGHPELLVNTHANGDHCFGNQRVVEQHPGIRVVASAAAAEEMPEVPPALMAWANRAMRVVRALPWPLSSTPVGPATAGELARYWLEGFARFDFGGITLVPPTETFRDALTLSVGDVAVELIVLGPAHTRGDTVAWVPARRTLFTGDLLFHGGTPIVWVGPVSRWVAACDRMIALDPVVVVPGHGPLADVHALRAARAYLAFVDAEARARLSAGMEPFAAARDIAASRAFREAPWASWSEPERLAVNVDAVAREVRGTAPKKPVVLFAWMAALARDVHQRPV